MNDEVLKNMGQHNKWLSEYACKDEDAIRFTEEESDIRGPFFRDMDRIIYTYAYIRYSDKTQVYPGKPNDHITKRMVHVQYVSKIARTIGRALGLNEDLIEAASLGHDLGHVPFGHFGESVLNEISLKHNEGYFHHNVESVRILKYLEKSGKGLNITLQVLDAIMCHNGEFALGEYHPKKKTKDDFMREYENTYKDKDAIKKLVPMTLEGCVVRISDIIAYLGRDIDDAVILGKIKKESIPKNIRDVLGIHNRDIVNTIIVDIINNSVGKNYIKLSPHIFKAIVDLKKFNYENIYDKSLTIEEKEDITSKFNLLFDNYLEDVINNRKSRIFDEFLNYKDDNYQNSTTNERKVIDFIAGMTDDYFMKCAKEIEQGE